MPEPEHKKTVLQVLQSLRGLDDLKQLFWTELNYERENSQLSDRGWPEAVQEALAEAPLLLACGGSGGDFHVIYNRLKSEDLPRNLERQVVNQLLKEHPYALLVFSNERQNLWHFLNVKYDNDIKKRRLFRRITVRPGDGLRTAAERIDMLDLERIGPDLFGLSPLAIQACYDEAFDVEKVTKDFYKELANWYFWAREHAVFPKDAKLDAEGKPSVHLIRLITRLIFCWFLREKRNPQTGQGLLTEMIFDHIEPSRITIGEYCPAEGLLRHIKARFPESPLLEINSSLTSEAGKLRYPRECRIEMFRAIAAGIRCYSKKVQIALCKETPQIWKAVGLEGKGLHCNCTG